MSEERSEANSSAATDGYAAHTPGPWHVPGQPWFDDNKTAVYSAADPHAGKLICANMHADFNPEGYEPGEVEANTRLIAAAPELLAACKAVLDCEMKHDEDGKAYLKVPARSLNDLGYAIACVVSRAEGKPPAKAIARDEAA